MFQQGLSGLNAADTSLKTIGNNIANASTVGFKGSVAQFADLYANSLNGVSGNNPGIGVSVSRLAQQFTQGGIETTNNPLDISINGGGFFRTEVNGAVQYSRNGQFLLNKDGVITNAQGALVTGYVANKDGVILAGAPVPIKIDNSDLKPVATTKANFALNLDSRSDPPVKVPFSATDGTTFNKQTVLDVYDSLGNKHIMGVYYVKTAPNTWDVYMASDGIEMSAKQMAVTAASAATAERAAYYAGASAVPPLPADDLTALRKAYAEAVVNGLVPLIDAAGGNSKPVADLIIPENHIGSRSDMNPQTIDAAIAAAISVPGVKQSTLVFDRSGNLDATAMAALTPPQKLPLDVTLPLFPDLGSLQPLTISTNFLGITQYGSITSEKSNTQDGYSSGSLERFAADEKGVIIGQYSNGKSRPLAQFVLVDFPSVDGLIPLGNNAWAESSASGAPQVGVPGDGKLGKLRSSSVEVSNVDLTKELVNMITAQRVYQANAQTIKTQDSIMQTLVNLR
ncbi:flagellar hook protein FlgE [Massilia sp. MB5]|uniref:flagellar hook protein FlgE n=1 Tax=unclassified Massilia TaxID=2609279 RepID=UPI00067D6117|nr:MULTISPECIES: flagellar hook protein FlgE [unclassified Massilia]AKU24256.1 flagellar hook-basal body protein [Massilia sp. NR 4-1]UMR30754.1 flagellar hook protein FlgE [Massilia sp. MB5]